MKRYFTIYGWKSWNDFEFEISHGSIVSNLRCSYIHDCYIVNRLGFKHKQVPKELITLKRKTLWLIKQVQSKK